MCLFILLPMRSTRPVGVPLGEDGKGRCEHLPYLGAPRSTILRTRAIWSDGTKAAFRQGIGGQGRPPHHPPHIPCAVLHTRDRQEGRGGEGDFAAGGAEEGEGGGAEERGEGGEEHVVHFHA